MSKGPGYHSARKCGSARSCGRMKILRSGFWFGRNRSAPCGRAFLVSKFTTRSIWNSVEELHERLQRGDTKLKYVLITSSKYVEKGRLLLLFLRSWFSPLLSLLLLLLVSILMRLLMPLISVDVASKMTVVISECLSGGGAKPTGGMGGTDEASAWMWRFYYAQPGSVWPEGGVATTAEAVMVGRRLLVNMASATNAVYRGNALFLMY